MESGGKTAVMGRKIARWLDEIKLSAYGLVLATRFRQFWVGFILIFIVFGTLLNLFASGFAAFNLMGASDFIGKLNIIEDATLKLFGVNTSFVDWANTFFMALLQGCLIGLIILIWKKRPKNSKIQREDKQQYETSQENTVSTEIKSSSLQNTGIVAGLAILGSGCPTCGTALLTPILGAVFSGSGYAVAGTVSGIINFFEVLLALWTMKKLGLETYVIITNERRNRRKNGKNR